MCTTPLRGLHCQEAVARSTPGGEDGWGPPPGLPAGVVDQREIALFCEAACRNDNGGGGAREGRGVALGFPFFHRRV